MIDGSAGAARQAAETARFAAWWTRSRRLAVLLAAITMVCAASGPFLAGRGDGGMILGLVFVAIAFLAAERQAMIDHRLGVAED